VRDGITVTASVAQWVISFFGLYWSFAQRKHYVYSQAERSKLSSSNIY